MSIGVLDIVVRVGLVLATTFLFVIVFLAYLRLKNHRMLLVSVGFGIFWVHALISLPEVINESYHVALDENMHLFIHLVAMIFILIGILKD
jgi:uncharacterized membrane protein YadS